MSDKEGHGDIIIIKRYEEDEHEAHSSAWKVAHADFMTAMMAFFLIMWLINVTDKDVRKAIAQYFNPVDLASSVTDVNGLNDPEDTEAKGTSSNGDKSSALKNTVGEKTGAGADRQQGDKERTAFQDPYAMLDKLAGDADPTPGATPDAAVGEVGAQGNAFGDTVRDPFDPTYWQMSQGRKPRSDEGGKPARITMPSPGGKPDAAAARQLPGQGDAAKGDQAKGDQGKGDTGRLDGKTDQAQKAGQSGTQAGIAVPGTGGGQGGSAGQTPAQAQLQAVQQAVQQAVKDTMTGPGAPRVDVRLTKEGLVVNLTDDTDFSMFPVGSAVPDGRVVRMMAKIAQIIAARPGEIVVRGHTDARPFRSDTYDNWRLSTARAHMAHYMLVRGGLDEKRVVKIEGLADRELKNNTDPNAAQNRRIEILLRSPS